MDENKIYPGKVGLQQRVLPAYRVAFLEALAKRCLSLIHISEPTRLLSNSYAVFCLKKKMYSGI